MYAVEKKNITYEIYWIRPNSILPLSKIKKVRNLYVYISTQLLVDEGRIAAFYLQPYIFYIQ